MSEAARWEFIACRVIDTKPLRAAFHNRGYAGGDRQSNEDRAAVAPTAP